MAFMSTAMNLASSATKLSLRLCSSRAGQVHIASATVCGTDDRSKYIRLQFAESGTLDVPLVWLRDHCRSARNYNWETNQRRSRATKLFAACRLSDDPDALVLDERERVLKLRWRDATQSIFTWNELLRWSVKEKFSQNNHERRGITLWNSDSLKDVPSVGAKNFDFPVFARLFARFGVASVNGVDSRNEKATKELCTSIGPIQGTFFGDFWTFSNASEEPGAERRHEDTAYSNEDIGPHTDGTYLDQTPGIQVFHCLKPATFGGDTILVDGFAVAEQFRKTYPKEFDLLRTIPLEHHYVEKKPDPESDKVKIYCRSTSNTVIKLDKTGALCQIRFNPYDRAPMKFMEMNNSKSCEEAIEYYDAYEKFSNMIHDPLYAVQISLRPGTVIFIDNHRVLHARTSFEGTRKMCGCYMSRDNFCAHARPVLSKTFSEL